MDINSRKDERVLEVTLSRKKINWQIKRQHRPRKNGLIYIFKNEDHINA